MKFTKMHGCGNDYVYVNCFEEKVEYPEELAVRVSDRHFGIGSDGLILICPSDVADCQMRMYNADGSEGRMCGNGIRCVAKYVYDYGLTDKTEISVETKSGVKQLTLTVKEGRVTQVKVNMGAPILEPQKIPAVFDGESFVGRTLVAGGKEYSATCVSMGNPHVVVFVEDTDHFPLETVGPMFERHSMFPDRVNTEFVQVISRTEVKMRVWERGSGETLACGTGACATAVACVLNGRTEDEVTVHLLGGDLLLHYDRKANTVWMTGPAEVVFEGTIAE